jgi:hypothetical protein
MKLFILLFSLTIVHFANGQPPDSCKIRFDGFYQTKAYIDKEDNDTTYSYLRFYADGKVIEVTSEGTALDLKDWFNLNMKNPSVGNYKIRGKRMNFSTTSGAGTVIYKGKIKNKHFLISKSKSLINSYKEKEEYYFISVTDMK